MRIHKGIGSADERECFSEQVMLSKSGRMSKAEPGKKQTNEQANKQNKREGRTLSHLSVYQVPEPAGGAEGRG